MLDALSDFEDHTNWCTQYDYPFCGESFICDVILFSPPRLVLYITRDKKKESQKKVKTRHIARQRVPSCVEQKKEIIKKSDSRNLLAFSYGNGPIWIHLVSDLWCFWTKSSEILKSISILIRKYTAVLISQSVSPSEACGMAVMCSSYTQQRTLFSFLHSKEITLLCWFLSFRS